MERLNRDDLIKLFQRADEEKFAIPAFNYSDIWDLRAIVEAAEEEKAIVMVAADPPVFEDLGHEMCAAMVDVIASQASVPIIHHLDHCSHVDICGHAIGLGFKSVMMDASDKPLEENIAYVRRVTDMAHPMNCFVEAEIGRIRGESAYETSYTGDDYLFDLDEAVELVEKGHPDSLAIGIGNAHGFYVGKPEINFRKLAEANEAIKIPLVLHGGTGIPREDIQKAIRGGINKVNVGTAVYCAYMNGVRDKLMADGENQFTQDVMRPAMDRVKVVIKEWIHTCMVNGKA